MARAGRPKKSTELTAADHRTIQLRLEGCSCVEAWAQAHPRSKSTRNQMRNEASKFFKRPEVAAELRRLEDEAAVEIGKTAQDVIAQLHEVLDLDGLGILRNGWQAVGSIDEIPMRIRRLIKSFDVKDTPTGRQIKITWMDKDKAADMLLRVHGAYAPEEVDQTVRVVVERDAGAVPTRAWDAEDDGGEEA